MNSPIDPFHTGTAGTSVVLIILLLLCTAGLRAQKPLAYYKFDNSAKDYSGNGNDGQLHGSVTPVMDRFGNHCGAYLFDGVTGYIEVPSSPTLEKPLGSITITTWYRFNNKRTNYWLTAICKGATNQESSSNPQYRLQAQQDANNTVNTCPGATIPGFSTVSLNTGFTGCDNIYSQHPFRPFEWGFYAMVFTGTKLIAYMNDQKVFEADYLLPLQKNTTPLYIGMDEPGVTEYFDGALDDLYLFDVALSEQEILSLYRQQRPANWDNEEFTATTPAEQQIDLPGGQTTAKARFEPPHVTNNACGKVTVTQIMGQPSGTPLPEGKHLIMYKIASETGYEQHTGFYITVKGTPAPATRPIAQVQQPPPKPQSQLIVPVKPASPPPTQTVAALPPQRVDTFAQAPVVVGYHPKDLDIRETIEQKSVEVSSDTLKLVMYDNAQYDGDTVSVFLNNKVVIAHQEVTIPGTPFWITIDSTIENKLVMYAENLGSIPPNTALMVLYDGDTRHEIFLSSTLSQNAMIRIRKKKK